MVFPLPRLKNQTTLNYKSVPQVATLATTSYKVVAGDSLYTVAKRFGMTVTALKSANGLTSDAIRIGQVLSIPGTTTTGFVPLSTGSSGSNVSTLQTNLKALGLLYLLTNYRVFRLRYPASSIKFPIMLQSLCHRCSKLSNEYTNMACPCEKKISYETQKIYWRSLQVGWANPFRIRLLRFCILHV